MKKILAMILAFLLVLAFICPVFLTGCAAEPETTPCEPTDSAPTVGELAATTYEQVVVDVVDEDKGYYCMYSDVQLAIVDGELAGVTLYEPTLLAFQLGSQFNGGLYLLYLDEGDRAIEILSEVIYELEEAGDTETALKLHELLEIMVFSGPITGEST